MTHTPLRRAAAAAAAALTLSLALVACGDEEPSDAEADTDTSSTSQSADVLSEDDLNSALLTADDLPDGYVEEPEDDEEDQDSFEGSCLQGIGDLTDQPEFESDEEAEASFVLSTDTGQSSIQSQVQSYADEEQIVSAIAMFSEAVAECTEASGTDPDGTSYDLTLESDQTVSLSGVDEQARVAVEGTITTQGTELPVLFGFNVARIANNLVLISTFDIGEVGDGIVAETDTTAQTSVDRLAEITG